METYSTIKINNHIVKHIIILLITSLTVIISSCVSSKTYVSQKQVISSKQITFEDTITVIEDARESFINGVTNQQKGEFAESILDFQEALKFDTTASIMYSIAESYIQLGRAEQAIDYSWKAIDIEPDFVEAYQLIGDIYLASLEFDKAKEIYEKLVSIAPTNENKYALARLYENDTPDASIKLYNEIIKDQEDKNILGRLSLLYSKKGDQSKYLETLQRLYEMSPGDESTSLFIIESYVQEKMYQEAVKFSDRLDKILSNEALYGIYGTIGNALYNDKLLEPKIIEELLKKVDSRFQTDWKLNMLGGMLANRIQDKVRMKAYFTKAQSITDTIPEVPLQIGFFYMQNKMDEDANKVFRDYEPMFPNEGQFPLLIGITYILMEEYDKALPPLHRALFLNKENLEVLLNIGHVYDQLDNTDSVHYYYGEALRLFPENPTINNNYAYFLAEHDTLLQKAKEMAFKATELEPKNSAYLDTYGWTLYKLKDYDQALTYVKMSISMGEAGAEVYEHLGDILKKRGEEKEAKQAYEEALKKEPDRISVKKKLANG